MNPAGIVLVIAGAWVVSQIFAGNALQRMNIVKPSESTGSLGLPNTPVTPWLPGGAQNPILPAI